MGRTVPTYRMLIESIANDWSSYRRALRAGDRKIFDSLIEKVRAHASACSYASRPDPMEAAFISILIEQQKEIRKLRAILERDHPSAPPKDTG